MSSDQLTEIKQNLLENKHDKNCDYCQKSEREGGTSLRQHYQRHYPLFSQNDFNLKFIDVRWNNHCNLSCIYCSPVFSSEWAKMKKVPVLSSKKSYQDEVLEWILEKSQDLQEVMLVGGEPLLMKQNHQLIQKLPDECGLSIITNLSYDLSKISCLQFLLDRPRETTNWNISVENVGQQFEYVRHGADWSQFLKNIDYISEHWPDSVTLLMVYGIFSATTIHETVEFFYSRGVKKFLLQSLCKCPEFEVARMPHRLKDLCLDSLEKTKIWHKNTFGIDADLYPIDGLEHIIHQLQNHSQPTVTAEDFLNKVQEFDNHTGKQFKHLWPEVHGYFNSF